MGKKRVASVYKPKPVTYSSGTTVGEQTIASSTTAPTTSGQGFELSELVPDLPTSQYYHPPEFLSIAGELTGTAEANSQVAVSVWFYFPDAATTNKWRESAPIVISGSNFRGAKGLNDNAVTQGNLYLIDCPAGATRAFLHAEDVPADVDLHMLVHPYCN
jgi:hypothetical protein